MGGWAARDGTRRVGLFESPGSAAEPPVTPVELAFGAGTPAWLDLVREQEDDKPVLCWWTTP